MLSSMTNTHVLVNISNTAGPKLQQSYQRKLKFSESYKLKARINLCSFFNYFFIVVLYIFCLITKCVFGRFIKWLSDHCFEELTLGMVCTPFDIFRYILSPTSGLVTMTLTTKGTGFGVTALRHLTPTGMTSHQIMVVCHAQYWPAMASGTMSHVRANTALFVRDQVSQQN